MSARGRNELIKAGVVRDARRWGESTWKEKTPRSLCSISTRRKKKRTTYARTGREKAKHEEDGNLVWT